MGATSLADLKAEQWPTYHAILDINSRPTILTSPATALPASGALEPYHPASSKAAIPPRFPDLSPLLLPFTPTWSPSLVPLIRLHLHHVWSVSRRGGVLLFLRYCQTGIPTLVLAAGTEVGIPVSHNPLKISPALVLIYSSPLTVRTKLAGL